MRSAVFGPIMVKPLFSPVAHAEFGHLIKQFVLKAASHIESTAGFDYIHIYGQPCLDVALNLRPGRRDFNETGLVIVQWEKKRRTVVRIRCQQEWGLVAGLLTPAVQREFYYIQMDKFARQALAEGITSRDDIVVTMESEIFRTLNQHYNRNNHVQPPENLVNVVQESLREFFDAIRLGKDAEPSWKKQIYK
ncbi:hypothetical protein OSTOST_19590, partial [Ostertagia ostertagi]